MNKVQSGLGWLAGKTMPIKKNKIVVTSYYGRGFSDSPKAIVEALLDSGKELDIVWLTKEPTEVPEGVRCVEYDSAARMTELSTAKIWIDNCRKGAKYKKDGQIYIEISYLRTLDTDVYLADVIINDPAFLKTALAEGAFGRNLTDTTSNIAEQNGAIFAVNGDYYGFRDTGYVMRNGYLYRSVPGKDPEQEDLVLYEDGTVRILRESEYTAEEIRDSGAVDVFSFGPGLVIDGEVSVSSGDEVERAQVTNPRTAFGVISPLHYLFVVSDGRTDESTGLSLLELADLMKEMGCVTAYNLDGGGSSTMWFNGKVLNHPTTFGDTIAERNVSDIVYIGK